MTIRKLTFIAALSLICHSVVSAQQLGVYLSTSYDQPSESAYAYAQSISDYQTGYYYSLCTSIFALGEEDNGSTNYDLYESPMSCDSTDAEVSWSFTALPTTDYLSVQGYHEEFIDYQSYQFDYSCDYDAYPCDSYWDAYGMSFLDGQSGGSGSLWYFGPPAVPYSNSQISVFTYSEIGLFCWYPQFENSYYIGAEGPGLYYGGMFYARLGDYYSPPPRSYSGRPTTEYFSAFSQNCWTAASPYSQPSIASFGEPSTWTIAYDNTYSTDYLGWNATEADYYQSKLPPNGSCTMWTDTQTMKLGGCTTDTFKNYDSHVNTFMIYSDSMTASRSGASGAAK